MAGYIRQSTFVDGDTITAALFNNEYNQLVNAFNVSSGHKHDGTTAEGPVIGLIGDAGETSPNNKVLIDTTNNYIEFYVEVSSAPVQQIYIADGAIIPVTDNDIDLGTSSLEFKDIYIDGTATIDTLTVDEAATVGTTLGVTGATTLSSTLGVTGATTLSSTLAVTGATTLSSTLAVTGTSTLTGNVTATNDLSVGGNLTVTGNATISGNLTFGDADTDSINLSAEIDSNIVPNTDDTYDLGTTTKQWRNLYIDGTAEIDTLAIDGTTVTSTAAELNILDGVTSTAAELNILDGVTSTTAELNILDGVTATAAEINALDGITSTVSELNIVDGDTAATSTTLADADRVVVNDAGTMVQVALTDFETYFESALDTLSNVTTVGALNAGSITSGFGAIDNGSSAITTTGTVTYGSLSDGTITITAFVDEDDMSSNSATLVPTQQSVKAYVDSQVTAQDLDFQGDTGGALSIDLDSESLTIAGGTGIDTSGATNTLTVAIDSTVTTLTGTQTLTNKTISGSSNTLSNIANSSLTNSTVSYGGVSVALGASDATPAFDLSDATAYPGDSSLVTTGALNSGSITSGFGSIDVGSSAITTTGTVTGGTLAGTLSTAAQTNITSVGTLSSLTVSGDATFDTSTLKVDSTNNRVGIGSASPSHQLEIESSSDADLLQVQSTAGSNDTALRLGIDGDVATINATGGSTGILALKTYGTERMRINSNGTIGIGTAGGSYAIDLLTTGNNGLRVNTGTSSADQLYLGNTGGVSSVGTLTSDDLGIITGGSERMRIESGGDVAIGITDADSKLHTYQSAGNYIAHFESANANSYGVWIEAGASANNGYPLLQVTSNAGSATHFRVDSGTGNVGVGTSSPSGGSVGGKVLHLVNSGATASVRVDRSDSSTTGTISLLDANSTHGLFGTGSKPMAFSTDSTERMRINSSGQLGIGTSNPSVILHTSTSSDNVGRFESTDATAYIQINDTADSFYLATGTQIGSIGGNAGVNANNLNIDLTNGNVGIGDTSPDRKLHVNSGNTNECALFESTDTEVTIELKDTTGTAAIKSRNDFRFTAGGSERMRIDSTGNVGIGTSSPSTKLHIQDADYTTMSIQAGTTSHGAILNLGDSGDINYGSITQFASSAGEGGRMRFIAGTTETMNLRGGNVGIGTSSPVRTLQVHTAGSNSSYISINNGNTGATVNDGVVIGAASDSTAYFWNYENAAMAFATNNTERARFDASGNFLLGKSSATATGAGCELRTSQLIAGKTASGTVNGIYFNHNTSYVGGLNYSDTATSLATSSDERLKENIEYSENSLDKINTIKVRQFDWKENGSHQDYGFVAQELEPIYDYAVHTADNEEKTKSVDYASLVPLLTKAIQEQQEQIDALQSEINLLKGE